MRLETIDEIEDRVRAAYAAHFNASFEEVVNPRTGETLYGFSFRPRVAQRNESGEVIGYQPGEPRELSCIVQEKTGPRRGPEVIYTLKRQLCEAVLRQAKEFA